MTGENEIMSVDNKEEINDVCRICLQTLDGDLHIHIFQAWVPPWESMSKTIAEDLAKIAHLEVSEQDQHSKNICSGCHNKLREACELVALARKSDNVFKQRNPDNVDIPLDTVWPKPIQVERINEAVIVSSEIKQEILSDEEESTNAIEINNALGDLVEVKVEPEEIVPADQSMQNIQITVNGTISLEEMNAEQPLTNGDGNYKIEYLKAEVKVEPRSEDDDDIITDLPLDCMLCTKTFQSISGLKAHVIAHHSYKSVRRKAPNETSPKRRSDKYVCVTCRRSFTTQTDLMVHETCHNKAVCYSCDARFDSFEELTKHRRRCTPLKNQQKNLVKPKTLEDVIRPHCEDQTDESSQESQLSCQLCGEHFTDPYYLKIHEEVHHSNGVEEQETSKQKSEETVESLQEMFCN